MRLATEYRAVWDLLFQGGKPMSTAELAGRLGVETDRMVQVVFNMKRRRLIVERPPEKGKQAIRYTIDGLCLAPQGATLAELQLPE